MHLFQKVTPAYNGTKTVSKLHDVPKSGKFTGITCTPLSTRASLLADICSVLNNLPSYTYHRTSATNDANSNLRRSLRLTTETGDDSAHFQETTEGPAVPHLMFCRTEGTFTTARRCCDVFVILAPDTKLQTYLLTYFCLRVNCLRHIVTAVLD